MSHVSFVYLFCFVELKRFKYYAYAEKNFNFDLCAFSVNDNNTEYLYIYVLYTQICIVRIRTHCTYFIHMREKLFFCKIHISITGNIFHILFKTDILKKYWQYTDTHNNIYIHICIHLYKVHKANDQYAIEKKNNSKRQEIFRTIHRKVAFQFNDQSKFILKEIRKVSECVKKNI